MNKDLYNQALEMFAEWFERARKLDEEEPAAVTLATADATGRVSARTVLLKSFDDRGFVFFSNAGSIKGRQLRENPRAALCFHWQPLRRQVQVEGSVTMVKPAESDAYWKTRARSSRIGAWASRQSEPLDSRDELIQRFEKLSARYASGEIPRPDYWTGYRLIPDMIEFWSGREHRLHERVRYQLEKGVWVRRLLNP